MSVYRMQINILVVWCQNNSLALNGSKTKEPIGDFRKESQGSMHPSSLVRRLWSTASFLDQQRCNYKESSQMPIFPLKFEQIWANTPIELPQVYDEEHTDWLHLSCLAIYCPRTNGRYRKCWQYQSITVTALPTITAIYTKCSRR